MKRKTFTLLTIFLFSASLGIAQVKWTNPGPGGGSDLHVLTFDPGNKDIIYVGGDIEGIFRTTDGGKTWENINNNIAQKPYGGNMYWINDIVVDPVDHKTVYLCSGAGLFKSTDRGDSWKELYRDEIYGEESVSISTIAIDPSNPQVIYMGLGNRADGSYSDYNPFPGYLGKTGLFRTKDGGKTWDSLGVGMPDSTGIHSIVMKNSDTLFISTTSGIFRSVDGGSSWTVQNKDLPHNNTHILKGLDVWGTYTLFLSMKTLADPSDSTSFQGGLFKSTDLGESWIDITSNLPRYQTLGSMFYEYWKFDVNPESPNIIFVATTNGSGWEEAGIYATWNGDSSQPYWYWVEYPTIGAWINPEWHDDPYVFDIKFAPSDTSRLAYCMIHVKISDNGGNSWKQAFSQKAGRGWKTTGMELMNTDAIGFHPANPGIFYVGYDDMGLFRTQDGGSSFIRLDSHQDPAIGNLANTDGVKDIEVDPDNGDLYMSRWGGSQGSYLNDYHDGGIVFSSDSGNTMKDISAGLPFKRCDLVLDKKTGSPASRTLYSAVYYDGVYKSTNSGKSWTAINKGLGNDKSFAWEIAVNPKNPDILYLGMNTRGDLQKSLYKSTDGGSNWNLLNNFPAGDILKIFVDKNGDVYTSLVDYYDWGYDGGLYHSGDGGKSWNEILDHHRIVDIQVHPLNDDVIVAAGAQWYKIDSIPQGIYLSKDKGRNWEIISKSVNHTFFNFARFSKLDTHRVYAGTAGGGLWVSEDLGIKVKSGIREIKKKESLLDVTPNPFTGRYTVTLDLKQPTGVVLEIYDLVGERKEVIVERRVNKGSHHFELNASGLSPGMYFISLKTNGHFYEGKKVVKY